MKRIFVIIMLVVIVLSSVACSFESKKAVEINPAVNGVSYIEGLPTEYSQGFLGGYEAEMNDGGTQYYYWEATDVTSGNVCVTRSVGTNELILRFASGYGFEKSGDMFCLTTTNK